MRAIGPSLIDAGVPDALLERIRRSRDGIIGRIGHEKLLHRAIRARVQSNAAARLSTGKVKRTKGCDFLAIVVSPYTLSRSFYLTANEDVG